METLINNKSKLPYVAIVGRPNVGKSALFNRIIRRRLAIVHEESGVTRDRITAVGEWEERQFLLIDTGGLGYFKGERITNQFDEFIIDQLKAAIESADKIIFVIDIIKGITPLDTEVANFLREQGKEIVFTANKADNPELLDSACNLASLGFGEPVPVSSLHNINIGTLLDEITRNFSERVQADQPKSPDRINVAFVGRPNVGKSSIINCLLNERRVIVSDIPGTTRDAVDIPMDIPVEDTVLHLNLIDTAGMVKRTKVKTAVEFFSMTRTKAAIKRADIVLLVIDATVAVTAQDKKISQIICDEGKACILLANKWDLASGDTKQKTLFDSIRYSMPYLGHAPLLSVCAISGYNFDPMQKKIIDMQTNLAITIPTPIVNRVLNDITTRQPPPHYGTHLFKIYYGIHKCSNPHTFLLFVNKATYCPQNYKTFLMNQLRKAFGLNEMPILLETKAKKPQEKVR